MALALILFCVFQVMTALSHVTATSSLLSVTLNTTLPTTADMTTDPEEDKHGKRSLNAYPFEPKYLSTETMTLEILNNGTVRGVRNLSPEYGKDYTFSYIALIMRYSEYGKDYFQLYYSNYALFRKPCNQAV